ncbi:MAG: dephospho-CoA kinase [Anaerohalosphaeraceae bacterium]|nr:dephospho-CoA kinase [Anaerohalosphaeraceae bacterium]
MGSGQKKPIIGLLGGISSGKSSVAGELGRRNCAVISADTIAKNLLKNPDVKAKLKEIFGSEIFDSAGEIDHGKLAATAFGRQDSIRQLNAVIHPEVYKKTEGLIAQYQADEDISAIVLDIPLLAETGWDNRCDKLVFVDCNEEIRAKRAAQKPGFDENELKKRENFQISLDKKAKMAHYTVRNEAGYAELIGQIDKLFPILVS